MTAPRILTTYLRTYYGEGHGDSNEWGFFSQGLFASLGWDEVYLPFEAGHSHEVLDDIRHQGSYDAAFFMPYQEPPIWLRDVCDGPIICWIPDDSWRFDFTRQLIDSRSCDWFITTYEPALSWYDSLDWKQVIYSTYGCRPDLWRVKTYKEPSPTAGFCGFLHGERLNRLQAIANAGAIPIDVHDCRSELLSLQDFHSFIQRHVFNLVLTEASARGPRQMKGRMFEPQIHGSVLVTEPAEGLDRWFTPGEDCVVFTTPAEAQAKMQALLSRPQMLEAMADLAFNRAVRNHTYQHRFRQIFETIGLPVPAFPDFERILLPSEVESSS